MHKAAREESNAMELEGKKINTKKVFDRKTGEKQEEQKT